MAMSTSDLPGPRRTREREKARIPELMVINYCPWRKQQQTNSSACFLPAVLLARYCRYAMLRFSKYVVGFQKIAVASGHVL